MLEHHELDVAKHSQVDGGAWDAIQPMILRHLLGCVSAV
jgi:hypothetical protein